MPYIIFKLTFNFFYKSLYTNIFICLGMYLGHNIPDMPFSKFSSNIYMLKHPNISITKTNIDIRYLISC